VIPGLVGNQPPTSPHQTGTAFEIFVIPAPQLVWAAQAGSVSGRIRKEPAGVRSGARLGQILGHLLPPAI